MAAPTTLPDALAQIEALRGQVRDLLQLLGQDTKLSNAEVSVSPAMATETYEFSEGLVPKQEGRAASQHLLDLHQMIETVPDVIFKLNLEGNLTGWNKRLAIVTGFSAQELSGRSALAFVPEHEHTKTAAAIRRAFEEGYAELEGHLLTKDGRIIPYHWTGAALRDNQGLATGITGVGRDVSEKHKAASLLDAAIDSIEEGILIIDRQGKVTKLNQRFMDLWRIPQNLADRGEDQALLDFVLEQLAEPELFLNTVRELYAHPEQESVDVLIFKDGRRFERFSRPHIFAKEIVGRVWSFLDITERTRAEQSLAESRQLLNAIIEGVPDPVFAKDASGRYLLCNDATSTVIGKSKTDVLEHTDLSLFSHEIAQVLMEKDRQIMAQRSISTYEERIIPEDGIPRTFLTTKGPLVDKQGQVTGLFGIARDITDRTKAEERLREMNLALSQAMPGISRLDHNGHYLDVNDHYASMLGYTPTELIGKSWQPTVHPDDLPLAYHAFEQMEQTGRGEFEARGVRKDGTIFWKHILMVKGMHKDTASIGHHCFVRDITERKAIEERLWRTQYAFDHAGDQIFGIGPDGRFIDVNESACRRLGYTKQELLTMGVMDIDPHYSQEVWNACWAQVKEKKLVQIESLHRSRSGEIYPVEIVASYHERYGQELDYAIVRDITDRKQTEEALRASESRLRLAMDIAELATWDWNILTNKVVWSENCERVKRVPPGTFDGTFEAYLQLVLPEDRPRLSADIQAALNGNSAYHTEHRIQPPGGEIQWVEGNGAVFRDEMGRPIRIIGTVHNITARKQAEQELRRFHEELESMVQTRTAELTRTQGLLQHVIDSSPDWIFVKDLEHKFLLANQSFARSQGLNPNTMLGRPDTDFWPLELCEGNPTTDLRGFHADDRAAFSGELIRNPHDMASLQNGTLRIFDTYKGPLKDGLGRIYGVLCYCRDVTEQRETERALRDSQARLTQAIEAANLGVFQHDHETDQVEFSPRILGFFNWDQEKRVTIPDIIDRTHPDDRAALGAAIRAAHDPTGDGCLSIDHRVQWPDGTVLWLGVRSQTWFTDGSKNRRPLRTVGAVQNITLRKQAEAELAHLNATLEQQVEDRTLALRASEERFNFAIEATRDGIWDWNITTGFVYFSPQWLRLLGYSPEDVTPTTDFFFNILHPDDQTPLSQTLQAHLKGQIAVKELEIRLRLKSGEYRWFLDRGKVVTRDEQGNPLRMVGTISDITKRKESETALSASEARFRAVFENAAIGIVVGNHLTGNGIEQVNPAFCRMTGFTPEELRTLGMRGITHQDDLAASMALVQRLHQDVQFHETIEKRYRTKAGAFFWARTTVSTISDGNGACASSIAMIRDITDQKRADEALRASEERYARATAVGKVGVWELDVNTEQYFGDTNLKGLFGYGADELSTDPYVWLGLVHPDDQPIALKAWESIVSGATDDYYYTLRMIRKDGTIIWTDVRGHAERDAQGHVQRLIGATVNITERKRAETILALENSILEDVTAGLPLPVILDQLTKGIEAIAQNCFCSIFLMEADGLHLRFGAAPSLPDSYTAAFSRFTIGPSVACCGTAAYHNKMTIVEDIASDPLWAPFKDHALSHGLQACWSLPINSSTGSVLGTFAVYYRTPQRPTSQEIQLIEQAARLAQIAIERHRAEDQLRRTQFAMNQAMDAVYWADPDARILYVNEAACRMLGYSKDELLSMTVHDLNPEFQSGTWPDFLMGTRQRGTWSFETQHRAKGGRSVPVDVQVSCLAHEGHEFLCAFVRDITDRKRREEALLNIVKGVTSSIGSAFFHSLTTHLASALGADYAVIGELTGDRADRIRTISVCAGGQIVDNFEYGLSHTPCQNIMRQDAASYLSGVQNQFPQFSLLTQLGVDGYSGTPLRDSEGRMLGIMAVLYRRPIPDQELTESMLQILAARAASELERQQAEQALKSSEERLRLSLLASNTGLWDWNTDTDEVWLSREWKRQIGYDDAELPNLFDSWESRLHPDDHDRAVAYAMQYREHPAGAFRQEFRLRHKDGTYRWIDVHASFMTESDGRCVRLLGSHTDITERKQAEEELQLFRALLDQVTDSIEVIDPASGRFLDGNRQAYESLGYTREELLGMTVPDIDPLVTPSVFEANMRNLREANGPLRIESLHLRKDGTTFPVEVNAQLLSDDREYLVAIVRDITERKRTDMELHRSHTFLRQVIDTTPNFIFAKDRHGRFTLVNQAIAEAYGTTVEALIGKTDADFNPNPDEVEFFTKKDLEVLDSLQERFIPEEKITDAAGQVRWLQTVKRPLLDDRGQVSMVLGASTDITARKGVELALRRRESDLQAAIAERERISEDLHDGILQSIYAVGLGLEACKPLIKDQPKRSAMKLKTELHRTIGQLNHVLEEVRNFIAGLDSHILDGQDFDIVLRTMVNGLAASYSIPCRMTIEKAAAQSLSTEQAYHILNVAREALSNSLRHSRADSIALSLKRLSRSVRLSVIDNGVGFNPSTVRDVGHGLANMASRAGKISGIFSLRSKLQGGTKVILDLPMT